MRRRHLHFSSLFAVLAVACNERQACVAAPCPLSTAVTVTVTSAGSGTSLTGAFVQVNGSASSLPCTQAPGSTCIISGNAGTYQLLIGAPGYRSASRSIAVAAHRNAACACETADTQHIDVSLSPSVSR